METTKREFRQLKREIKQAGSQHRRRQWKRDLRENPEEAPYSEDRFGRFSTAALNGNDTPRSRDRAKADEVTAPEDLDESDETASDPNAP